MARAIACALEAFPSGKDCPQVFRDETGLESMGGQGGGPQKGDAVEAVEQGESGKVFFEYVRAADFLWSKLWTKSCFCPAGWKEKALRLRRHRLAEQEIRGRIDEVGRSADSSSWAFVSHLFCFYSTY